METDDALFRYFFNHEASSSHVLLMCYECADAGATTAHRRRSHDVRYSVQQYRSSVCRGNMCCCEIGAVSATRTFWERFIGLGPGLVTSTLRMYWLGHVPVHWTRPVLWWSRLRRHPGSTLAGEGAPPEAPPGAPC